VGGGGCEKEGFSPFMANREMKGDGS